MNSQVASAELRLSTSEIQTLVDKFAAWDTTGLDSTYIHAKVWRTEEVQSTGLFAFGSCQYPAGILDRVSAEIAYTRLDALVQPNLRPYSPESPDALLLLGDQIYADLTAGLLDPVREDDRYRRPYEDLLQIPALQSILRKIPVYMMPDDHEIVDNWEPGFSKKNQQWKDEGLNAYWQYQRMQTRKAAVHTTQTVCGFALFMADSRTERALRKATLPGQIMSTRQWRKLRVWLLRQQRQLDPTAPKLISCASMVLPRHAGLPPTLGAVSGCLAQDAWDGYPGSLAALLGFIAEKKIRGVVLLSGDAHLGNVTEIMVSEVKLVSIHTPALYAPFPFANAKPADFADTETFMVPYRGQSYGCQVTAQFPPADDGFVTVRPFKESGTWRLDIRMYCGKTSLWSRQVSL